MTTFSDTGLFYAAAMLLASLAGGAAAFADSHLDRAEVAATLSSQPMTAPARAL